MCGGFTCFCEMFEQELNCVGNTQSISVSVVAVTHCESCSHNLMLLSETLSQMDVAPWCKKQMRLGWLFGWGRARYKPIHGAENNKQSYKCYCVGDRSNTIYSSQDILTKYTVPSHTHHTILCIPNPNPIIQPTICGLGKRL